MRFYGEAAHEAGRLLPTERDTVLRGFRSSGGARGPYPSKSVLAESKLDEN
jgi:hypothetical protein